MAKEPLWVELQPLTTVYLAAAGDGVTQPPEHYLNCQGYDVADLLVEVFALGGTASPTPEFRIETGPSKSAPALYDNVDASPRTSLFQEAASTASVVTARGIYPVSSPWERPATPPPVPLQKWLRWSVASVTGTGLIVTFRIHGTLRDQ